MEFEVRGRRAAALARHTGNKRDRNIMIVEDDASTREILRRSLERNGWSVVEAAAEDVAVDLGAGRATKQDYVQALGHLSAAVRDLQDIAVEPTALGGDT